MAEKPPLRAVIFDADGVIIDSERIWDLAQEEFLRRRGIAYDRDRVKPLCMSNSAVGAIRALQELYGFEGDPEEMSRERIGLVREHYQKGIPLVDGFEAFHDAIRGQYLTAVATAMERGLLETVAERLGLGQRFGGHIYTIADVGDVPKPNPDIFLHAAMRLGAAPAECLVIEDSPNGIQAARRAGMRCLALTTTFGPATLAGADAVVAGFAGIPLANGTINI